MAEQLRDPQASPSQDAAQAPDEQVIPEFLMAPAAGGAHRASTRPAEEPNAAQQLPERKPRQVRVREAADVPPRALEFEPAPAVALVPEAEPILEAETLPEAEMEAEQGDDASSVKERASKSSNMVSIIVIVSRITGFFRTATQAWALGAAGLASAYTVANNLPNLLYELVAGGMLITSFLPVYLSVRRKLGQKGAAAYASNLLSIVTVLMAGLTVLSLIFAAPIIWTQCAGAAEGFDFNLSVWFFRWFACEIMLYALSSIISGVLNAEREYMWSNIAPIFNNLIIIGSFMGYSYLMGKGLTAQALVVLAIGNPLGVAIQAICQLPSLHRQGVHLTPRIDLHDPALRETLVIGIPTLIATLASFPTTAVMSSCALQVTPAGSSIAYYSRIWWTLPYSIFAIPISLTFFTELSSSYGAGDYASFKDYLNDGTKKVVFTLVPLAMFLMVFSTPLIAVFASGAFDAEALRLTSGYLSALALSLPLFALSTYLQKVCSSMMRMYFFAAATVVGSVIQVVLCIVLTPIWGLYVVPISSAFYYGAIDVIILLNVRKALGPIGLGSCVRSFAWAVVLGLAGSVVGWLLLAATTALMGPCVGMVRGVLYAAIGGIPALVVTFGTASLLGVSDAPFFDRIFSRVLPKRAA